VSATWLGLSGASAAATSPAAAALIVAGRAQSLAEGVEVAAASIDEGKARRALDKLIALGKA
jgi:anthranilate phosphoribosyltransferase